MEIDQEKAIKVGDLISIHSGAVIEALLSDSSDFLANITTAKEAASAHHLLCNDHTFEGCARKHLIMDKWNKLAQQQVEEASDIEEAKKAYLSCPFESAVKLLAIRKLYELV